MNVADLSLHHVVVFNSVAKSLNMSKSAKELLVTQSAISQTIKDLETKFSVKLFLRKNRRLYLTEEGKEFYYYTKKIFDILEEAKLCLENFNTLKKGRVSIGASMTIGNYLLPELIVKFKQSYPDIDLSLFIANSSEVIEKLRTSEIDIALIEGLPYTNDKSIKITRFAKDKLSFICSPQHRFASIQKVALKDLLKEQFIMRERGSGTRQIIEAEFAKVGAHVKVAYEFNNPEAIKNAVSCNLGISALSDLIIKNELQMGMLKEIPFSTIKIYRWFYLMKINSYNKAQTIFENYLLEAFKNQSK
ncbi:Transcriptional regulator [Desulfurella amilsii]|uniref:Transcriptional regulator n=1 Tax=Desulfurella amilsii TaxID=1562698 RepID=A0A1X4XY29_9BACT|nr:LysR family transcriptional regulator [Desulfurella amilsii]OSS42446.1 Transcriptional regulator [Desulfurella amilsii]